MLSDNGVFGWIPGGVYFNFAKKSGEPKFAAHERENFPNVQRNSRMQHPPILPSLLPDFHFPTIYFRFDPDPNFSPSAANLGTFFE